MKVFEGQHFSLLYLQILSAFIRNPTEPVPSRVGPFLDLGPAVLDLYPDGNRWCLVRGRALNPFFALYELSWLLSGSNQLAGLRFFIRDYDKFSDDGKTLWGAYGHRLRSHFGFDQIEKAISLLANDPTSRRVSMSIWSVEDLGRPSADIPCNLLVNLKVRAGGLDISVANRSNDAFLGIVYNVLQFNCLQKYIGGRLGLKAGRQVHFIDSLHLYQKDLPVVQQILEASNEESILQSILSVAASDLADYARLDHRALARDYDQPTGKDDQFCRVRDSFLLWRQGQRAEAVRLLPETEVGLAAIFWYMQRKGFERIALPAWATSAQI